MMKVHPQPSLLSTDHSRPVQLLKEVTHRYPLAWQVIAQAHSERGRTLPLWPDHVYVPMAAAYSIVADNFGTKRLSLQQAADVSLLAALGAWRVTQGIYQFETPLFKALWQDMADPDLATLRHHRLPEWGVYIETPEVRWDDLRLYGFFVHLEHDFEHQRDELRLLLDREQLRFPIIIPLGVGTLQDALSLMLRQARGRSDLTSLELRCIENDAAYFARALRPIINLIHHLCSRTTRFSTDHFKPESDYRVKSHCLNQIATQNPSYWTVHSI